MKAKYMIQEGKMVKVDEATLFGNGEVYDKETGKTILQAIVLPALRKEIPEFVKILSNKMEKFEYYSDIQQFNGYFAMDIPKEQKFLFKKLWLKITVADMEKDGKVLTGDISYKYEHHSGSNGKSAFRYWIDEKGKLTLLRATL